MRYVLQVELKKKKLFFFAQMCKRNKNEILVFSSYGLFMKEWIILLTMFQRVLVQQVELYSISIRDIDTIILQFNFGTNAGSTLEAIVWTKNVEP